MNLTDEIRAAALEAGADDIGFGNIERFENAPPESNPRTIFPDCRTVIAIVLPQSRASLKTIEEGTYWNTYNFDSYNYLNAAESPRVARPIVLCLEKHGYTAFRLHNSLVPSLKAKRKTREEHIAPPDAGISVRQAAVACGLGEMGLNKLLLTPKFGPRQRIYCILTDARLEPTPLFRGHICDDCKLCVRACQAGAFSEERTAKFTIEDVEYRYGTLDADKCLRVHSGSDPKYSPFITGRETYEELPPKFYKDINLQSHDTMGICGARCMRTCLDHLEKTGRIERRFNTAMIDKKRWLPLEPEAE